jgi:hypothetical protein
LKFPQRPGYIRRVVNDDKDRIKRFEAAGYEVVRGPVENASDGQVGRASQIGDAVTRPVGQGMQGVLMEIPKEWYDEDQADKQSEIDAMEDSMRRRFRKSTNPNEEDGVYGKVDIGKK